MLKRFVRLFGGDPNQRAIDKNTQIVDKINSLENATEAMSREELANKTGEFRARLAEGETLDDILPEAFAVVREASKRTLGLRHYDVQLIGGIALHLKTIAEMRTGEGKTLVATLPVYLNALTGRGVHLITVNDYLARRDARWMAPIYNLLGLSVGVLQMAARTENGKKAFLVDLERTSPHEDQHQLLMVDRKKAYDADITYGTNSEFGFDYLRDNMTMRMEDRVQREHYYAIIDEVDNILIDEARTPLIISGPAQDESEWYIRMAQVVRNLRPEDYEVSEKDRNVSLTEIGEVHAEELIGMALRDPDRPEDVTPEQARLLGYLEQALRAQFLFKRNKDYLVQAGKVIIIDEFTGRLMPGRRWSDGLHQAVEAKEGSKVQSESVTYATITIQNYFRMYEKLAGMTGTALTEAEEFDQIYKLEVLAIPTNLEYQAMRPELNLITVDAKDEEGYKYTYYAHDGDPARRAVYFKRKDYPDVIYRTQETKLRSIAQEILRYHVQGRPLLVGTTSVDLSERVSTRLRAEPLRRLALTILIRQAWFTANHKEEDGRVVSELQYLNQPIESLDIPAMRKMARDVGISFNPEDAENVSRLMDFLNIPTADPERMNAVLKAGIPHQVLNARKHTEESQIIAGAGAFGAVTIATNMAGRGVDIKLGGELAEEILAAVNRVLNRAGHADPYDMTMEQRRATLQAMNPADFGIHGTEVQYFLQHMEDMERVRELGGLHVIGSERHEARRIDNQLRGRSARQGDPGSSRFYLSMEDELMRLFGGSQADNLMQRLKIDDALPLEVGLVSRIVEQSQTRVEGSNFDVRKHLLEYDDVLNNQRAKIYAQRNLIFTKDDLSADVSEMLRVEVNRRVPLALEDEEGPWKLLSWLDQTQPSLNIGGLIVPSYTLKLLVDAVINTAKASGSFDESTGTIPVQEGRKILLQVMQAAITSEENHITGTVSTLLSQSEERLEQQINERMDSLDTFIEGIQLGDETDTRKPVDLANELSGLLRLPLRLTPDQQRGLRDQPRATREVVAEQVESLLTQQAILRLVGAVERRLEENLDLDSASLAQEDWDTIGETILASIHKVFERRQERFLGEQGSIVKDLDNTLTKLNNPPLQRGHLIYLFLVLTEGQRASFDKKTHRRVWTRTTRLVYTYYAGHLIKERDPEEVTEDVLAHLQKAEDSIRRAWGIAEMQRLGGQSFNSLDESLQDSMRSVLGDEQTQKIAGMQISSLPGDIQQSLVDIFGRRVQTHNYRGLLLGVITELWVDYLTQMEGLRVSIGLEAYAQRDPLVQYKSRAFELFQLLLDNMRLGVVSRMFTYRPRQAAPQTTWDESNSSAAAEDTSQLQESGEDEDTDIEAENEEEGEEAAPVVAQPGVSRNQTPAKKRRRRRR